MRPLSFCFNQYGSPTDWARDLAGSAALSSRAIMRMDAVWEYCDPNGTGRYDFSNVDARLAAIAAHGVRAQIMVPMWAPATWRGGQADKTQVKTTAALDAFVAFVAALVAHIETSPYRSIVRWWETGNEVNLRYPFAPDGADPEWQATVTNEIFGVFPKGAKIMSPGLAPAPSSGGSLSPLDYVKRYWPKLTVELDACGVHPYGNVADVGQSWSVLTQMPLIHGITGLPLVASEQNTVGGDATKAVEEPKALDWMISEGYVERVFVYAMSDPGTDKALDARFADPSSREFTALQAPGIVVGSGAGPARWGLLNPDGSPRPEYGAIKSWVTGHSAELVDA